MAGDDWIPQAATAVTDAQLSEVRERLDAERRKLARRGEHFEILPHISRVQRGPLHEICHSSLTAENADAVIDEQVRHYRALGVASVEWKLFSHDTPGDLRDRLVALGFVVGQCETVMVLDLLRDPPGWLEANDGPPVIRVTTLAHVAMFRHAAEEIFGKDYEFTAGELLDGISAGSTEHVGYIAVDDGLAVSIGRLYTHPQSVFGGLYGGGTRASHRGRGLYRRVVAARARDAIAFGARYLMVDALPTSRPILERMGFARLAETWPCEWSP
jgi:hypothetical protein